jgi:hypothetical protein
MVGEFFAGVSAIKSAFGLAKGLKDIDDATRRNAAVIELQEKILIAQSAQSELIEQIRALETEMTQLKAWGSEKERYELKAVGSGAFAYMLKPEARGTEPPHWLCPNCYAQSKKSFFQGTGKMIMRRRDYSCTGCNGTLSTEDPPQWIDD